MKIRKIKLDNFMLFNSLNLDVSGGINVICGDNSTGKTVLLKTMYSVLQTYSKLSPDATKEETELLFAKKLQGVFRPDENSIGRLVSHRQGSNKAEILVETDEKKVIELHFGNHSSKRAEVSCERRSTSSKVRTQAIYLPPKEIISATENFASLYEEYHIAFEETYYDLAKLLNRPLKKGANTAQQNKVLEKFESIISGKIIQRDKKFYLNVQGAGEFEMGLVSEGYRKLATILYLISSGSLTKDAILFWDEPETNMNPKMIRPIVEVILELAKMGVQVFVTTHDYFVLQELNLAALYPQNTNPNIRFIALYKDDGHITVECAENADKLVHNSIMDEFDNLYNMEQALIDGDSRK